MLATAGHSGNHRGQSGECPKLPRSQHSSQGPDSLAVIHQHKIGHCLCCMLFPQAAYAIGNTVMSHLHFLVSALSPVETPFSIARCFALQSNHLVTEDGMQEH